MLRRGSFFTGVHKFVAFSTLKSQLPVAFCLQGHAESRKIPRNLTEEIHGVMEATETSHALEELYRRWRRRELLRDRVKVVLGLGAFAALIWMTIQLFGK